MFISLIGRKDHKQHKNNKFVFGWITVSLIVWGLCVTFRFSELIKNLKIWYALTASKSSLSEYCLQNEVYIVYPKGIYQLTKREFFFQIFKLLNKKEKFDFFKHIKRSTKDSEGGQGHGSPTRGHSKMIQR